MKQIVINSCCGSFGLSDKGMKLYAELRGIILYPEEAMFGTVFFTVPPEERIVGKYSEQTLRSYEFSRDDPTLIKVVRKLGKKANGRYSSLEIIEIPDDVKWHIEECDGVEWVAEDHRTWPPRKLQ